MIPVSIKGVRKMWGVMAIVALLLLNSPAFAEQGEQMKIRCVIGSEAVTATLDNTSAAREFLAMLPLTLTMRDFAGTEKISGNLGTPFDTDDSPSGYDPSVGDIAYYAPWGNLALFYRDGAPASGLFRLGRLADGVGIFGPLDGDFKMTIERSE